MQTLTIQVRENAGEIQVLLGVEPGENETATERRLIQFVGGESKERLQSKGQITYFCGKPIVLITDPTPMEKILRDFVEVQRAHDIITGILLEDVPNPCADPASLRPLRAAGDVLCWVLKHDHNPTFGDLIVRIKKILADAGYRLGQEWSKSGEVKPDA